jgi:hypothetical protein
LSAPGFFFASATSSCSERTGRSGWTAITSGDDVSFVTGSRSFA